MKPVLSIIFIENQQQYNIALLEDNPLVELISLSSNSLEDISLMNYGIRMATGEYLCLVLEGDKLSSDFIENVINACGGRRDAIVFESINSDGVTTKYTSMAKKFNFAADGDTQPIQYFHPVKRRLIKNVMFVKQVNRDHMAFYSKELTKLVFSEVQIKKKLITSDRV